MEKPPALPAPDSKTKVGFFFSRDDATVKEYVSVRPSVGSAVSFTKNICLLLTLKHIPELVCSFVAAATASTFISVLVHC